MNAQRKRSSRRELTNTTPGWVTVKIKGRKGRPRRDKSKIFSTINFWQMYRQGVIRSGSKRKKRQQTAQGHAIESYALGDTGEKAGEKRQSFGGIQNPSRKPAVKESLEFKRCSERQYKGGGGRGEEKTLPTKNMISIQPKRLSMKERNRFRGQVHGTKGRRTRRR